MIPPEVLLKSVLGTLVVSIFASTGFWAFITTMIQRRDKKKDGEANMLRGLGHDRICYLGECFIKRGNISKGEYENLKVYLYEPYKKLGGNGTAEKVMKEVEKLPLRDD